jgi:hypothetical protein
MNIDNTHVQDTPRMNKARSNTDNIADAQFLAMSDEGDKLELELAAMTTERDAILKACQDMKASSIIDQVLAEEKLDTMTTERDKWIHEFNRVTTANGKLSYLYEPLIANLRAAKNESLEALQSIQASLNAGELYSCPEWLDELIAKLEKVK